MPGHTPEEGLALDFMHRLRELDHRVEELRATIVRLQRHLATQQAPAAARADGEDYLRAYV